MWRVTPELAIGPATSGLTRWAKPALCPGPALRSGFTVTLRCPRAARAKGDGRCTSAASFEARWRSHLRMTMRCVTFSLTWRRYLCYQMPRISLIEGRQPVTTDWWSGCGSCGRGSSPRLRAVRASSPPALRPGRGVLRLSAIGGAGNACALPLARSAAWAELERSVAPASAAVERRKASGLRDRAASAPDAHSGGNI